jgi:hypothetical protein
MEYGYGQQPGYRVPLSSRHQQCSSLPPSCALRLLLTPAAHRGRPQQRSTAAHASPPPPSLHWLPQDPMLRAEGRTYHPAPTSQATAAATRHAGDMHGTTACIERVARPLPPCQFGPCAVVPHAPAATHNPRHRSTLVLSIRSASLLPCRPFRGCASVRRGLAG